MKKKTAKHEIMHPMLHGHLSEASKKALKDAPVHSMITPKKEMVKKEGKKSDKMAKKGGKSG